MLPPQGIGLKQLWTMRNYPSQVHERLSRSHKVAWLKLVEEGFPSLLALGMNPLMLRMLVKVYESKGHIPKNRGRLLDAFVDVLIERERKRTQVSNRPGVEILVATLVVWPMPCTKLVIGG